MNSSKVISSTIESLKRVVKVLRFGRSDVQTAYEAMPFGVDSSPLKDMSAIYSETGTNGKAVIIGYINKNQMAEPGETRLFSLDSDGNLKTYLYLKKDGNMDIGGDDDFMVRYSKLEEAFNDLKESHNDLVQKYNIHTHLAPGGATSATATTATPSDADISGAKIEEIRTIG